jgi:hypothetical protein
MTIVDARRRARTMTDPQVSIHRRDGFDIDRSLEEIDDTRPALSALVSNQREMLDDWLGGFESRESLIGWAQDCCIATLGELSDDWYVEMLFSDAILAMVLEGPKARVWTPTGASTPSTEISKRYRVEEAAANIVPACNQAMRTMRYAANEYVGEDVDDGDVPEARDQAHVAMRPALSELDARQEATLEKLLDGFEDDDELLHWALVASQSSFAELDGQFASALEAEHHTRDMLVGRADAELSAEFREDVAANDLIPAFNAAAGKVIDSATEADSPADSGEAMGGSIS